MVRYNSINLQLYCDDTRLIRYYQVGWPGSVYDSNVFSKCKIAKHPEAHLSPGELLIGDAGYMLLWYFCTPYRQPTASIPHNKIFNDLFSSARTIIEHVNGILKNRWASSKGIRIQVKKKKDFAKINEHIIITSILHNMLTMWGDEWAEVDEPEEEDLEAIRAVSQLSVSETANELRIRVQSNLLHWFFTK